MGLFFRSLEAPGQLLGSGVESPILEFEFRSPRARDGNLSRLIGEFGASTIHRLAQLQSIEMKLGHTLAKKIALSESLFECLGIGCRSLSSGHGRRDSPSHRRDCLRFGRPKADRESDLRTLHLILERLSRVDRNSSRRNATRHRESDLDQRNETGARGSIERLRARNRAPEQQYQRSASRFSRPLDRLLGTKHDRARGLVRP